MISEPESDRVRISGLEAEVGPRLGKGGHGEVHLVTIHMDGESRDFAMKSALRERDIPELTHEAHIVPQRPMRHVVRPAYAELESESHTAPEPVLIMPLQTGGSLQERIDTNTRLGVRSSEGEVAETMAQVTIGLRETGLVHRDIKPANVLFDGDGTAQVVDWGLARRNGEHITREAGTLAYMAPESIRPHEARETVDAYSVAATAYSHATGERWRSLPPEKHGPLPRLEAVAYDKAQRETGYKHLDLIINQATHADQDKRSNHMDVLTDLAAYPEARAHYSELDKEAIARHLVARFDQNADNRSPVLDRAAAAGLLEDGVDDGPTRERLEGISRGTNSRERKLSPAHEAAESLHAITSSDVPKQKDFIKLVQLERDNEGFDLHKQVSVASVIRPELTEKAHAVYRAFAAARSLPPPASQNEGEPSWGDVTKRLTEAAVEQVVKIPTRALETETIDFNPPSMHTPTTTAMVHDR